MAYLHATAALFRLVRRVWPATTHERAALSPRRIRQRSSGHVFPSHGKVAPSRRRGDFERCVCARIRLFWVPYSGNLSI
jgi:hypothetical protein